MRKTKNCILIHSYKYIYTHVLYVKTNVCGNNLVTRVLTVVRGKRLHHHGLRVRYTPYGNPSNGVCARHCNDILTYYSCRSETAARV